jgi:RNA-directed DNA polymerase
MSDKRAKIQKKLAFSPETKGEAPKTGSEGTESLAAKRSAESPAETERMMEEVVERENLLEAWKRVKANKGSPGGDGMTVQALPDYLREHWPALREQLLKGTYKPQPVRGSKARCGERSICSRAIRLMRVL